MVDMENLTNLTKKALASPAILDVIELLKKEIIGTEEPFVWKVLPQRPIGAAFPKGILSGWIFVLKPRTCSPSHLHPNSTHYSAVTEGSGKIRIGEEEKEIQIFDPSRMFRAW